MILARLFGGKSEVHLERFRPSPWYYALDPKSGVLHREFHFRTPKTSGFYDEVEGTLVALYRSGEALFFRAGDVVHELRENVSSTWAEHSDGKNLFALAIDGEAVFRLEYTVPVSALESEDAGFEVGRNDTLRAVHDVVSNPRRWQERFREEQQRKR